MGCLKIRIAYAAACFKCQVICEKQQTTTMLTQTPPITLQIKAQTWYKQSHFLFDYQSNRIYQSNIIVSVPSKPLSLYMKCEVFTLTQMMFTLVAVEDGHKLPEKCTNTNIVMYEFIARIELVVKNRDSVQVHFIRGNKNQRKGENNSEQQLFADDNRAYRVVKSFQRLPAPQKGEILQVGQIIKLGKARLFVREISINNIFQTSNTAIFHKRETLKYKHHLIQPQQACRICLVNQQTMEDQLISPCKCAGSCKWLHLHCFSQWLNNKIQCLVRQNTFQYNIEKLICEICKETLPIRVQKHDETIQTALYFERPKGDYIVLQRLDTGKSLFVVKGDQRATIGRSLDENVIIQDIAVSRSHAFIQLIDGDFYLYDQNSKFGTLITEENLKVQVTETSDAIQIGRNKLEFKVINPSNEPQQYYSISSTQ